MIIIYSLDSSALMSYKIGTYAELAVIITNTISSYETSLNMAHV